MHLDLRCISACLVLLALLGVSLAVPLDLYNPEAWREIGKEAVRGGDAARRGTNSVVDSSITTFDRNVHCRSDQACKKVAKNSFQCHCIAIKYCVTASRLQDAYCKYSGVGVVYEQPSS